MAKSAHDCRIERIRDGAVQVLGVGNATSVDGGQGLVPSFLFEESFTGDGFPRHDTEREDVAAMIALLGAHLLRRHVRDGSANKAVSLRKSTAHLHNV